MPGLSRDTLGNHLRLAVIGGSDAGISAALRAREVDRTAQVRVIVADSFPNFSICGLPFYLSGEVPDWHSLAHRTCEEIQAQGIELRLEERALEIDAAGRQLVTQSREGQLNRYGYDRILIATGAVPVKPAVAGLDLPNVFMLHTMEECFALHRALAAAARSAVIVGGGYIGLEMADALRHRNLTVTLVEQLPAVMRTVDSPMARRVESLLRANGVEVRTKAAVDSIVEIKDHLQVRCADGYSAEGDLVLVVVGVRPQSDLAKACDIRTNERGAIHVDRGMRTNRPDIFAAGDCTVTWHRLLERDLYLPLGTTSHKQGRVAGENAVGGERVFEGSLGTQSVKLFDRVIAATGLREEEARLYGFDPLTVEVTTYDHKAYYPGTTEMILRLVGDVPSGRLLGGQIFGAYGKEVSKRVDTLATALHYQARVGELSDLDLSYTPPLSSPGIPCRWLPRPGSAPVIDRLTRRIDPPTPWSWEVRVPELETSVFVVPGTDAKNGIDRYVVLNRIARSVIEECRGVHDEFVFTDEGHPQTRMNNSGRKAARRRAAARTRGRARRSMPPCSAGFRSIRVHDLKHTFGHRLRAAGVCRLSNRQNPLGHTSGSRRDALRRRRHRQSDRSLGDDL